MEPTEKRPPNKIGLILIAVLIFLVVIVLSKAGGPSKPQYHFVTADHPVDMWTNKKDRWAYFFIGGNSLKELGDKAREELTPLGFQEDTTESPWIRFVKGSEEIVVCNHQDFATISSPTGTVLTKGMWPKGMAKPTADSPCVLIKNGPGTNIPMWKFTVEKIVYRW